MNFKDCIYAAEKELYRAQRNLEGEGFIHRVPDELQSSILWAMEAWLLANGHRLAHPNGWASTLFAFHELAPKELWSEAIDCFSEASFLDYEFQGGDLWLCGGELPDDVTYEPMSWDEWVKSAHKCLDETKKIVAKYSMRSKENN